MKLESPASSEKTPGMEKIHTFFAIDSKTEKKLKAGIEQSNGLVRVFVHPDFEDYSKIKGIHNTPRSVENLKKAQEVFNTIISSTAEKLPPLFIFESGWHAEEFLEKEEALAAIASHDVYVIRTEGANPNPLPPDHEHGLRLFEFDKVSKEERTAMWKWVIEELKKWGAKKILIGGLEFHDTLPGPEHTLTHEGCLGDVI